MDALKKVEQAKARSDYSNDHTEKENLKETPTKNTHPDSLPSEPIASPDTSPPTDEKELQFSIENVEPYEANDKEEGLTLEPEPELEITLATAETTKTPTTIDKSDTETPAKKKSSPEIHSTPAENNTVRQQVPVLIGRPKVSRTYLWGGLLLLLLCSGLGYYYMTLRHVEQSSIAFQNNLLPVETAEIAPITNTVQAPEETPKILATKAIKSEISKPVIQTTKTNQNKEKTGPVKTKKTTSVTVQKPLKPTFQIKKTVVEDPLQLLLQNAYARYQEGSFERANSFYHQALRHEANNQDALLGLAIIAQRQEQPERARVFYQRLLVLNPKNSAAASGLISLNETGVTTQNISQLKRMLQEEPTAAHLHFSLASKYALQSRWPEAQQSYFQAYHYAPSNADYAFNLAVSLEKLGQSQTAIPFYKRALSSANNGAATSFERKRVTQRIETLTTAMPDKQGE